MTTSAPLSLSGQNPRSSFLVLVVCTANLCRSPMAAALLGAALPGSAGWDVRSAGTNAQAGTSMHPLAAAVLTERGHDPSDFRSSELDVAMIDRADLVLTAERSHRAAVAQLRPPAVRYTFTLREFARLLDGVGTAPEPTARLAGPWLIDQAISNRSGFDSRHPDADDVADPIGRRIRAFRRCADSLGELTTSIAAHVTGRVHVGQ